MRRRSSGSVQVFYPKLTRDEVIQLISARLKELNKLLPLMRVILFGSYARGNYTVGSDIDLLVVYRGGKREDAYALVKKVLDLPRLEPHIYTEAEYEQMRSSLQKMIKGGIELLRTGYRARNQTPT